MKEEIYMNIKKSKYRNIIRSNNRYRLNANPLNALYQEDVLIKKAASDSEKEEVKNILSQELTEDFKLGGHSDYDYLLEKIESEEDFEKDENRVEDQEMSIVYIDLRNFSKRALFIDDPGYETIKDIADLKQEAISTWIKLARFYQGHIHANTGDGLMVLFGGKKSYDSDEWTLGARAFLFSLRVLESEKILNDKLKKYLKDKNIDEKYINSDNMLDIKVSLDYSPNTLMNPQGVIVNTDEEKKAVGEVKATSFEIDVCAKMLSNYKDAKESLDNGESKLGRALIFGEKYSELMNFGEDVEIFNVENHYKRTMYNTTNCYKGHYIDAKTYKGDIITLEDVAGICDVSDDSEEMKEVSKNIASDTKIQHG